MRLLTYIFGILLGLVIFVTAFAQPQYPNFRDYPVKEDYTGKVKKVNIVSKQDRMFHTQLKEAMYKKPNFAGHYYMLQFGCGGSCVSSAAIDAKTGDVFWLPFTVSNYPIDVTTPVNYRLDSYLVEIVGSRNEQGQGKYYYKFENDRFVLVKDFPV